MFHSGGAGGGAGVLVPTISGFCTVCGMFHSGGAGAGALVPTISGFCTNFMSGTFY